MTRYHKSLALLMLGMMGLWGCARSPETGASGSTSNDRVKILEARTAKLEEELKLAMIHRDSLRHKLAEANESQRTMQQELDRLALVERERDEMILALRARTEQLDLITYQYEGFRRNLRDLLDQADAEQELLNSDMKSGIMAPDTAGPTLLD